MGRLAQGRLRPLGLLGQTLLSQRPLPLADASSSAQSPVPSASSPAGGFATPAMDGASLRSHPVAGREQALAETAQTDPFLPQLTALTDPFLPHRTAQTGPLLPHGARGTARLLIRSAAASPARGFASAAEDPAGFVTLRSPPELWREQAYASGLEEYSRVAQALRDKRMPYLLRDLYEDMVMDGIELDVHTWHLLIVTCKRQRRLQDTLFFFNEMRAQGRQPDTMLYNCIIAACAVNRHVNHAFKFAEEMEANGLQPSLRTFTSLLIACGVAGHPEEAVGVVQRMKAQGFKLDMYGYSALISAYKNSQSPPSEREAMVFQLFDQYRKTRGTESSAESQGGSADGEEDDESHFEESPEGSGGEEGGNQRGPEGGALARGFYQDRRQPVYRAAFRAMVFFRSPEGANRVLAGLREDGMEPDIYITVLQVQLFIALRDMGSALETYYRLLDIGNFKPTVSLQVALIGGAIRMYTPQYMDAAKQLLADFERRGFFLSPMHGTHLLRLASKEVGGDVSCANAVFDHVFNNSRHIRPGRAGILFFLERLQRRGVPPDDERLVAAMELLGRARNPSNSPLLDSRESTPPNNEPLVES